MDAPAWDFSVRLHAYTFFERRDEFISRDSRFVAWVLLAAEAGEFAYEVETEHGIEHGQAGFGDLIFAAPRGLFWRHIVRPPLTYHVLQFPLVDAQGEVAENLWQAGKWPVRDTARLASTLAALRQLSTVQVGRGDAWSARRRAHLLEELLHLAWETRIAPLNVDPAMQEAAHLLRERAGQTFSMREVSTAVGLGPVQFTRRFRAAFGQNPIEFLTEIRLANAQQFLIETSWTLDAIAARCGWASGAYLASVFTQRLHTTPGRFRRLHRV